MSEFSIYAGREIFVTHYSIVVLFQ